MQKYLQKGKVKCALQGYKGTGQSRKDLTNSKKYAIIFLVVEKQQKVTI